MLDPQLHLEFYYLVEYSIGALTDFGGVTEEATYVDKSGINSEYGFSTLNHG